VKEREKARISSTHSTDRNKATALEFLRRASGNSVDAAMELLDADVTWWVAGDPSRLKVAGLKNRSQAERLLRGFQKAVPGGMHMTVLGITAENERVAVETEGEAQWRNGKQYHNRYHFLFEVRNSLIVTVREYLDTLHLHDVSQG